MTEYHNSDIIVSRPGASSWEGAQIGLVIGSPFSQSLLSICTCISFRQDKFWIESFVSWCPYPSTGRPAWLQEIESWYNSNQTSERPV